MSFLLGAAWYYCIDYNAWMSLSGYRVDAQDPAIEERMWEIFPSDGIRFWPSFINGAKGMGQFLECDIPVSAVTSMSGFGRFVTTIKWLEPWFKVMWSGRIWCVSRDGRMWDADSVAPFHIESAGGPLWHIPSLSEKDAPFSAGVISFPISTDEIAVFLDEYQNYGWFADVSDVSMERRAGYDMFRLSLSRRGQRFEILIQSAKYEGQELGAALQDILSRLSQEGGNHIIDATYEGKILLKKLIDRPTVSPSDGGGEAGNPQVGQQKGV